jgi:hypothetical protein
MRSPVPFMDHPIRTLFYELLVEPLLRFLQRILGTSAQ